MASPIEKIKAAVERLDYYGAPPNDSPVFVEGSGEGCLYELLDGEEGDRITLGDLRDLITEAG